MIVMWPNPSNHSLYLNTVSDLTCLSFWVAIWESDRLLLLLLQVNYAQLTWCSSKTHVYIHTHICTKTQIRWHTAAIPSGLLSEFTSDSVRLTQADSTLDSLRSGCSSDGWQPLNNGHIVHLPVILPYLVVAGFSFTVASHWEAGLVCEWKREVERQRGSQCTYVRVNGWA